MFFAGLKQPLKEVVDYLWPDCRTFRQRRNAIAECTGIGRGHHGLRIDEIERHTEALVLESRDTGCETVKRVSEDKY